MKRIVSIGCVCIAVFGNAQAGRAAQQALGLPTVAVQQPAVAPILVPVSGVLVDERGQPRVGSHRVRIAIYASEDSLAPLWFEHQDLTTDAQGSYATLLGATQKHGVPPAVFVGGDGRWIGIQVDGESELPRGLLTTTPYAAKAVTADALGGVDASEYVTNGQVMARVMASLRLLQTEGQGGSGEGGAFASLSSTTPNMLAKFLDGSGTVGDSTVIDVSGRIGIGTTTPVPLFHVRGSEQAQWVSVVENVSAGGFASHFGYNNGTSRYGLYVSGGGGDANSYYFLTDNSKFGVRGDGRVGIGGVAPEAIWHVRGVENANWVGVVENGATAGHRVSFGYNNGVSQYGVYVSGGSADANSFYLLTDNSKFAIRGDGRVGIGTGAPEAVLDVRGDLKATGSAHVVGNITAGGNIAAKYQDVAEWVEAVEDLPPGTVVAADPDSVNKVRRSQRAYDTTVLGVISTQPGVLLGEAAEGRVAVAQSGRVLVKVDARHGAIRPGDLLVASPTPGVAMLSRAGKGGLHRPGTIIGKALQGLARGTGEILVLITLQ